MGSKKAKAVHDDKPAPTGAKIPKLNVIIPIKSYDGNDTWLEVGGDRLEEPNTMYAIVTVYDDGATTDFGYATKKEAIAASKSANPNTPVNAGE